MRLNSCSFALLLALTGAASSTTRARAAVLWTENAENGYAYVIDNTSPSYPLIQSDVVGEGANAFHLANPGFQDNWFAIDQSLTIEPDTKLFFLSRLGWATNRQVATVQISTNGGATWPTTIYSQPGTGDSGEGGFSLKEISLAPYASQTLRFRFLYDFLTSGSAFTQTDSGVGWYIDDIQIADQLQKIQYSIGNPSPDAQLYLEHINRARADARLEASRLAAETDPDITSAYSFFGVTGPNIVEQFQWYVDQGVATPEEDFAQHAQPLAFNAKLNMAAELHAQDMFNNQFQGHDSSGDPPAPFLPGDDLGDRASAVGYNFVGLAENVYSYGESPREGHAAFDVDWGNVTNFGDFYNPSFNGQGMQNEAGHRLNIHNPSFKEIGVGVVNGTNGSVGPQVTTQDFGNPGSATFVTGVVYEDLNSNSFYDLGEGRPGVRVDVEGSAYYAVSAASGGYSVPVSGDGLFDVLFSGGGFGNFMTTANILGGANVKIDYLVSSIAYAADFNNDGHVDGDDLAQWRGDFGLNPDSDADNDGDSDGQDLLVWQRELGSGLPAVGASAAVVPEPVTTAPLLVLGALIALHRRSGRFAPSLTLARFSGSSSCTSCRFHRGIARCGRPAWPRER